MNADIPHDIAHFSTYIVAYSGGKDSTAVALWSLEHLPHAKLRFAFCPTGAQWPETFPYLEYIEDKLGITIERIRAGDRQRPPDSRDKSVFIGPTNLYDMIRKRGMWPGAQYRYCTAYLKRWPLTLYARQDCVHPVLLFGQRAGESKTRSKLPQYDAGGNRTGIPIYRPILRWSQDDVWQCLATHNILPNPVYNYATRANCWCCPMARQQELFNFCCKYPEEAQRWADLEVEIGHTWHERMSIGNILKRARAQLNLFSTNELQRFAGVSEQLVAFKELDK